MPFSEEVLAGRGDIDDKRMRMVELEAQVCACVCAWLEGRGGGKAGGPGV